MFMENQKSDAQGASAGASGVPKKRRRGRRGGRRHHRKNQTETSSLVKVSNVLSPASGASSSTGGKNISASGKSATVNSGVVSKKSAPSNTIIPSSPSSKELLSSSVATPKTVAQKSRNFRAAISTLPSTPHGSGLGSYAFLDAQNISVSISRQRWKIDWFLVRSWLAKTYDVRRAVMFLGYLEEQEPMYDYFNECGYDIVFKPVHTLPNGETKGNVDAEIVLHAMAAYPHYDRAVLMSGDGDFACLVTYLRERNKLGAVVAPNAKSASSFLRDAAGGNLEDMSLHREAMTYRPGRPGPKPVASLETSAKKKTSRKSTRKRHLKKPHLPTFSATKSGGRVPEKTAPGAKNLPPHSSFQKKPGKSLPQRPEKSSIQKPQRISPILPRGNKSSSKEDFDFSDFASLNP